MYLVYSLYEPGLESFKARLYADKAISSAVWRLANCVGVYKKRYKSGLYKNAYHVLHLYQGKGWKVSIFSKINGCTKSPLNLGIRTWFLTSTNKNYHAMLIAVLIFQHCGSSRKKKECALINITLAKM